MVELGDLATFGGEGKNVLTKAFISFEVIKSVFVCLCLLVIFLLPE